MKTSSRFVIGIVALSGMLALLATVLIGWTPGVLAAEPSAASGALRSEAASLAFLAAALATGLSSLAAAYAVASVGAAAIGALAEKPELFGRLLIVIGLAEGIAIYGLIISIMILTRLG